MPVCSKCKEEKPTEDFYVREDTKLGRRSHCKVCMNKRTMERYLTVDGVKDQHNIASRKHLLRTKYGLTLEQYEEMHTKQGGVCYICGLGGERSLSVDHNHTTGNVRKLLCHNCNIALGHAMDSISVLKNMIDYLEEHTESDTLRNRL
jgi:hypothetical protein